MDVLVDDTDDVLGVSPTDAHDDGVREFLCSVACQSVDMIDGVFRAIWSITVGNGKMLAKFGGCHLELVQGDITDEEVDVIVNAANSELAGGGGVDGAIHDVGGALLMQQTCERYPDGCPTGTAVMTDAGDLKSKYVAHAVGPVWRGGQKDEQKLLVSAYRKCLELAVEHDCKSIAFPAISTGAYGYPVDLAAETSINVVREFLFEHGKPELVRLILFDAGAYGAFARVLESIAE